MREERDDDWSAGDEFRDDDASLNVERTIVDDGTFFRDWEDAEPAWSPLWKAYVRQMALVPADELDGYAEDVLMEQDNDYVRDTYDDLYDMGGEA